MIGALGRGYLTLKDFRIQKSVIAWPDDNAVILLRSIGMTIFQSITIFLNLN
jgi:hypothetical protein